MIGRHHPDPAPGMFCTTKGRIAGDMLAHVARVGARPQIMSVAGLVADKDAQGSCP